MGKLFGTAESSHFNVQPQTLHTSPHPGDTASFNKTTPDNPSQTVLPTGGQVFKHRSLREPILILSMVQMAPWECRSILESLTICFSPGSRRLPHAHNAQEELGSLCFSYTNGYVLSCNTAVLSEKSHMGPCCSLCLSLGDKGGCIAWVEEGYQSYSYVTQPSESSLLLVSECAGLGLQMIEH